MWHSGGWNIVPKGRLGRQLNADVSVPRQLMPPAPAPHPCWAPALPCLQLTWSTSATAHVQLPQLMRLPLSPILAVPPPPCPACRRRGGPQRRRPGARRHPHPHCQRHAGGQLLPHRRVSEPQERYPELQRDSNGKLITVPLEAVNLCFFTTIVTAGSGRGMVIGTGDRCAREAHEGRARGPLLAGASATALAPPVHHLPPPSTSTPPPTCRRRFCCLPACPRTCPPAGL